MKFRVKIHCASCAFSIEKALKRIDVESQTNAALKITKIISNPKNRTEKEIIEAIKEVGYEATRA